MSVAVDVKNPGELWNTCFQVLSDNVGDDAAQAFINLNFGGNGDFTKERHERPDLSAMDVERIINMAKTEAVVAGRSI
jgi:hypothetical protein